MSRELPQSGKVSDHKTHFQRTADNRQTTARERSTSLVTFVYRGPRRIGPLIVAHRGRDKDSNKTRM